MGQVYRARDTRLNRDVAIETLTAGGPSGDPASPHFIDQAERHASGNLRDIYFYPAQMKDHTARTYRPGR